MNVDLILNGRRTTLECAPATMLLDVAARREGLTSVRETCGIGVCGACTVLLDGEPVSGCLTLAAQAAGPRDHDASRGSARTTPCSARSTTTHAFQCGWCTPGFVLTARPAGREPGRATRRSREALGGNLCRCGCYVKIARTAVREEVRA